MHKLASPPLINHSEDVSSIQVNKPVISGVPALNWNLKYKMNDPLNLSGYIDNDGNFVFPNYILDYKQQPFNYLEITSSDVTAESRILQINFIPTCWIYIRVVGATSLIISPQSIGSSSFNSANNYTLTGNTKYLVFIKPSVTSVLRSNSEAQDQITYTNIDNDMLTVSAVALT